MIKGTVFSSSVNPEKLALTVKGLLMSILPIVLLLTQKYGITEGQLVDVVTAVTALVSAGATFYGVLRKLYYSFK